MTPHQFFSTVWRTTSQTACSASEGASISWGRRRAVMEIPLVVVGHKKAGVERDHERAASDPMDDGVDLLAEPFIALRVRFRASGRADCLASSAWWAGLR